MKTQLSKKSKLTTKEVSDYLINHPDFFVENPKLLDKLKIHHESKGAISLVEFKLEQQREKIYQLENKLAELTKLADYNNSLFFSLFPLQQELSSAKSLIQANQLLADWALQISLKKTQIFLLKDSWEMDTSIPNNFWLDRNAFETIRLEKFGLQKYYLGKLNSREKSLLFAEDERLFGSVAICLVNNDFKTRFHYDAVILFADHDEQRFHNKQDLSFLKQLSWIFEKNLSNWLKHK